MREINDFDSWAQSLIDSSLMEREQKTIKRSIPQSQDVMYQAQRKYRDLSPEDALSRFLADKLDDFDKRDLDQNRVINRQRQENEKLRGQVSQINQELQSLEAHSAEANQELSRIKQLGGKLQTDIETRKVSNREVQEIMAQVDALRTKSGMNPEQFNKLKTEVEKQIQDFRTKGVDSEKFAELQRRLDSIASSKQVDRDELVRVQDLVGKVEIDQREIETGRIDVAAKLADLEKRQDDIEQREKNIDKEIDAKVVQAAVRAGRRGTQAEYKRSKERLNKLENEVIPQLVAAEKDHEKEIEGIKDHDRIQDELIRDLHPQKAKVSAIKKVAHPQNLSWYQQELLRRATSGDARKMATNPRQQPVTTAGALENPRPDQDGQEKVAESYVYEQPEPEISDEENQRVAAHYARQFAPIFYSEFELDPYKRNIMRRYAKADVLDAIVYSTFHWLLRMGRYAVRDEERVFTTMLEILVEQHPHIEHEDLIFDKNKKFKGQTRMSPKPYSGRVVPPRVSPNPDDGEEPGVKESRLPKRLAQDIDNMAENILGAEYSKYLR